MGGIMKELVRGKARFEIGLRIVGKSSVDEIDRQTIK